MCTRNVLGAQDLHRLGPEISPNGYSVYLAKADLLYATSEWCLNNEFKYRLNSAQRSLRNGIIAVIIAGALAPRGCTERPSPWPVIVW